MQEHPKDSFWCAGGCKFPPLVERGLMLKGERRAGGGGGGG